MKNCMDEFMTTRQVAEILGVTSHSVNNYIAEGRLPATKVNAKTTMIAKSDFESVKNNLVHHTRYRKFKNGVTVTAVFEKTTRDRLEEMAQARGVSASEVVREAVIKYIEEAK